MKFDGGKPRMSLVPLEGLEHVAQVATYGALKYAARSWQDVPDGEERYLDALCRHVVGHMKHGPIDPETGLVHIAQVAWNALAWLYLADKAGKLPKGYDFSAVRAKFEAERTAAASKPTRSWIKTVEAMIEQRREALETGNPALAKALAKELTGMGVQLHDEVEGTRWSVA